MNYNCTVRTYFDPGFSELFSCHYNNFLLYIYPREIKIIHTFLLVFKVGTNLVVSQLKSIFERYVQQTSTNLKSPDFQSRVLLEEKMLALQVHQTFGRLHRNLHIFYCNGLNELPLNICKKENSNIFRQCF